MKQGQWPRLLVGLIAVFIIFQWSAESLGSDRGQAGIIVGLIVVAATLAAERLVFGKSFADSARAIGLARPKLSGLLIAATISGLLLLSIPVFALLTGSSFSFYPGWGWLVPGLFFQAGVAEETLFRGYLF